jgi:type I restriction enzyme S subunit
MVESELGEIPKGWEIKRLKQILNIKRGGSPRPIHDYMASSGLPWVKISDATALNNPFLFSTKEFIKVEGLRKTILLKKGSLILSNSATPGLPKFLELDACIHDGWLHFQDIELVTYNFLYLLFLYIRVDLVGQGNGSIFINLKTDILKEYAISIPNSEVLEKFSEVINPIFENIKNNASENIKLTDMRDYLLPKLISGELEINEISI